MKTCAASNCHYPVFSNLYCKAHQYMRKDDKYDRRTAIQKHFGNQKKDHKPINDDSLEKWFNERRKEGNSYCDCGCGNKVSTDNKYFKYSLAHVLPKSKFISIATHPENCLHLAFWGGCHSILDDKGYEYCKRIKPFLWDLIVKKFLILYPCIAPEEHKFIPDILMYELENNILNEII